MTVTKSVHSYKLNCFRKSYSLYTVAVSEGPTPNGLHIGKGYGFQSRIIVKTPTAKLFSVKYL